MFSPVLHPSSHDSGGIDRRARNLRGCYSGKKESGGQDFSEYPPKPVFPKLGVIWNPEHHGIYLFIWRMVLLHTGEPADRYSRTPYDSRSSSRGADDSLLFLYAVPGRSGIEGCFKKRLPACVSEFEIQHLQRRDRNGAVAGADAILAVPDPNVPIDWPFFDGLPEQLFQSVWTSEICADGRFIRI